MITIYLKQYNKIIRNADTKLFDELGYDDILWIDMLLPTIKEQKAVENFMEISLQTKQQVEEIESTSKYPRTRTPSFPTRIFSFPRAIRSSSNPCRSSFRTRVCSSRCAAPSSAPSARRRSACR